MDMPPLTNETPTWRDEEHFCEAIRQNRVEAVRASLTRFGRNIVNAKFTRGDTGLHWSVWCSDNEIAKMLVANGADVNLLDDKKNTPLMLAASAGNAEMVEVLLAKRAKTDLQNAFGQTAAICAQVRGYKHIVDMIDRHVLKCEEEAYVRKHQQILDREMKIQQDKTLSDQKKLKSLAPPLALKKKQPQTPRM